LAGLVNTSGGELFQFRQGRDDGPVMGFNQSLVMSHESQERNRLGRRKREIVENAPISDFVAGIKACSFMALSQSFACDRIQVLAELQEIIPLNGIPQTEPFRSKSPPPTNRLIVGCSIRRRANARQNRFPR